MDNANSPKGNTRNSRDDKMKRLKVGVVAVLHLPLQSRFSDYNSLSKYHIQIGSPGLWSLSQYCQMCCQGVVRLRKMSTAVFKDRKTTKYYAERTRKSEIHFSPKKLLFLPKYHHLDVFFLTFLHPPRRYSIYANSYRLRCRFNENTISWY